MRYIKWDKSIDNLSFLAARQDSNVINYNYHLFMTSITKHITPLKNENKQMSFKRQVPHFESYLAQGIILNTMAIIQNNAFLKEKTVQISFLCVCMCKVHIP